MAPSFRPPSEASQGSPPQRSPPCPSQSPWQLPALSRVTPCYRAGAGHAASRPGLGPPVAACCWALLRKPGPSARHLNALCLLSRSELSRTRPHHFTTTIGLGSKLCPRPSLLTGLSGELGNSGVADQRGDVAWCRARVPSSSDPPWEVLLGGKKNSVDVVWIQPHFL